MMRIVQFSLPPYNISGYSAGSSRTALIVKPLKILIDMGYCFPEAINIPHLFITHGHVDHLADLVYYVAQRKLFSLDPPQIFAPAGSVPIMQSILSSWGKLEEIEYGCQIQGLSPGDKIALDAQHFMQAIPVMHRIESLGYLVFSYKKKIKPEFRNLAPEKLRAMRLENQPFEEQIRQNEIFFSGDTYLQGLMQNEDALSARIVFIECTFIDDKRDSAAAFKWGHLHLDDIVAHAHIFSQVKTLVLYHFSRRYKSQYIHDIVMQKLPPELVQKTVLFI